jgi:hypothetical protein
MLKDNQPAHQEMAVSSVKRAAGSDPRPEAVQPPFQGLGGLGEECAGNTRGSSVCLKAINPINPSPRHMTHKMSP